MTPAQIDSYKAACREYTPLDTEGRLNAREAITAARVVADRLRDDLPNAADAITTALDWAVVLADESSRAEQSRAQLLAELFDQAEDGDIPGTVIRHDGLEVTIHTTGQVTGWLHTLHEKAKGSDGAQIDGEPA